MAQPLNVCHTNLRVSSDPQCAHKSQMVHTYYNLSTGEADTGDNWAFMASWSNWIRWAPGSERESPKQGRGTEEMVQWETHRLFKPLSSSLILGPHVKCQRCGRLLESQHLRRWEAETKLSAKAAKRTADRDPKNSCFKWGRTARVDLKTVLWPHTHKHIYLHVWTHTQIKLKYLK